MTEALSRDDFQDLAPDDQQEDESDLLKDKLGDPGQAVMYNVDWTVATIVQQIENEKIDLDPEFQRRSAWDDGRKSRLIESLILGLPIPNIVLAERREGRGTFMVIDGKQRLSTFHEFMSKTSNSPLILKGLKFREDLNRLSYGDLRANNADDVDALDNTPIRTIVIRNWPTEEFLYVIFDRLNSGSLPLSPQELRRAVIPGKLLGYIDRFLEASDVVKATLGLRAPDRRMRDSELVLRFIAFEQAYPAYDGDFKMFLDNAVRHFNDKWDNGKGELDEILKRLETALRIAGKIFGPKEIFRKWNEERQSFERAMNRALFDAITRFLVDPRVETPAIAKRAEIVAMVKSLCESDQEFKRSIELSTKKADAVSRRLETWGRAFAGIIGWKYDPRHFRIQI